MCPLELVATPMPSPRYRLGGSFRKFGAESKGISGTFCALARALSCAGVRPSAGVCANWGIAHASAAHNRQVFIFISLLLFFDRQIPIHRRIHDALRLTAGLRPRDLHPI